MAPEDDAITRSEEELHDLGTRVRPVGRVRLVKRIVTEYVDVRVPLRREELHVFEEEAIEDGEVEAGELTTGEDTLEIVLYAEEPVIETRVVPRERVRAHLEVVTAQLELSGELRREVVEVEERPPAW